jgi:hypothetical protein
MEALSQLDTMNTEARDEASTTIVPSTQSGAAETSIPSTPPTSPTDTDPSDPTSQPDSIGIHAFNYYFLIVAGAALLLCGIIIYFGRRRKRKAALMNRQSHHALARDVESWRSRFRGPGSGEGREHRVEGLDERGEAPPPYVPGGKPPSLRDVGERDLGEREIGGFGNREGDVELRNMNGRREPPGYEEASRGTEDDDVGDVTRPRMVHTAGSVRRLLSDTRSAS